MNISKIIFAFVLTAAMIFSMAVCGSAATTFSDVDEAHPRYEAISELAGRGIINGYTDGTFLPDKAVTRAEMAKLIATMFSISEASTGANPFSDVAEDYWARNFILAVKNLDIINGYPDGTYLPDKEVTWQEAVKMIVYALNWGVAAEQTYPSPANDWAYCYRRMAQELGLSQNALMTYTDPAPRGVIAQLFFNALDIPKAVAKTDNDGNISYVKETNDNTTVNQDNNYSKLSNVQVVSVPGVTIIDGTQAIGKEGYIRLKDVAGNTYDMSVGSNTGAYEYLGRYVNVLYQEKNREYTISTITDLSDHTEIKLDKIKSVSGTQIEYYTDDKYSKTATVKFQTVDVIYNERPLKVASDFVTLLNNAKDVNLTGDVALSAFGDVHIAKSGTHAMITIKAYKSYYMSNTVNSTNASTTGYVVTLDGRTNTVTMNVKDDVNNEIIKKTSLESAGTKVSNTLSISTKSVITIAESADASSFAGCNGSIGNKYIEFFANNSKKTGTIDERSTAKGLYKGSVTIDGKTMLIASDAQWTKLENATVGSTIEYYTDATGNLAYIVNISRGNMRFGFYSEYLGEDATDNTLHTFKFYDPTNSQSFTVKVEKDDMDSVLSGNNSELFWMNIASSKVRKGEIFVVNSTNIASIVSNDDTVNSIEVVTADKVYKSSSNYVLSGNITPTNGTDKPDSTYGKVFWRPEDVNASTVTYTAATMTQSSAVKYDNAKAYIIKKDDSKTYTYLLIDPLKQLTTSSPVYIVKTNDETEPYGDNQQAKKLGVYNFKNGSETSVLIAEDVANTLNLQVGDIFTYYDDCKTAGVKIDKTSNVYILLRASQVASDRGVSVTDPLDEIADNFGAGFTSGFKTYGMSSTNVMANLNDYKDDGVTLNTVNDRYNYYNYSLQIPVWYDADTKELHFARTDVTGTDSSTPVLKTYTYADKDVITTKLTSIVGDDWNAGSILTKMGENETTMKKLGTSLKLFVYDKNAVSDEEKFKYVTDAAEKDEILSNISTMENTKATSASDIESIVQNCTLTYTYFSGYSTLNALYIIK